MRFKDKISLKKCLTTAALAVLLSGQGIQAGVLKLQSITPFAVFNSGLNLKSGQGINSVNGPGAGAIVKFGITSNLQAGIIGGYNNLTIDQPDPIPHWNWEFWNRFYGNYIRDLQRDSNYVADLSYQQRLNVIPVLLMIGYQQNLGSRFKVSLSLAGGIYLLKRTLSVHERWSKRFPEKDYTFSYQFDNHANPHSGNIPGILTELEASYRIRKFTWLNLGLSFNQFFGTDKEQYFPFKQLLQMRLGIQFTY